MKKVLLISILVSLCVFGLVANGVSEYYNTATVESLTEKMVGVDKERVDEVVVAGRTCYMYVPQSNRVGNFLTLTPMVMVFGDKPYDAKSVLEIAHRNGFAEIAQRDGICILFVNPLSSWTSEEDKAAADELFAAFFDIYCSKPSIKFEQGVGIKTNKETGEQTKVYPGSLHGVQLFGYKSGADYIAANYLRPMTCNTSYSETDYAGVVAPPSGVCLLAPSFIPLNSEDGPVIPMAVVDGPENVYEAVASYQKDICTQKVVNGLNENVVVDLYDEVVSKYYYSQGQFRISPKYQQNGIIEINDTKIVSTGKAVELYEYIPSDVDINKKGSVPALLWFHGFGGEAEAMLSWSEWPIVGKENGFMVISVDQHVGFTAAECVEAFEQVLAEYEFIDQSRLYVSGFSMGSAKTWEIALNDPKRFAAIVPCALGVFGRSETIPAKVAEGGILPVFYLAGGNSAMERGASANTQAAMGYMFELNNIGPYSYDATKGEWGATPSSTTVIGYVDEADYILDPAQKQQTLIIDEFKSQDGNAYTWFALNLYKPHTLTNNDAHIVWDYIKNFSRAEDGTLVINN